MPSPSQKQAYIERLASTSDPNEQIKLRSFISDDEEYLSDIVRLYVRNPFLRLLNDEIAFIDSQLFPVPLRGLVKAREAAVRSRAPRHIVFCMPKSGSSFVQSALQHALGLPFVGLTSFGSPLQASRFGMNSREQELDELALIKSALAHPRGFVAQHHTRYSQYLALQMRVFAINPIVTVRNVPDCIVSFDDMMLQWRAANNPHPWSSDAQFALPENYPELRDEVRYDLLSKSFGIWLINFYLSWKRCGREGIIEPLVVRYEEDILDRARLVTRLSDALGLSEEQRRRLADYAAAPDKERSRLNVGRRGRGREKLPERCVGFLSEHALHFRGELSDADIAYLIDAETA